MFCGVLEDEEHALFHCRAHSTIRNQQQTLLNDYISARDMLNPRSAEDIVRIAKYLQQIEKNMEDLGMKR